MHDDGDSQCEISNGIPESGLPGAGLTRLPNAPVASESALVRGRLMWPTDDLGTEMLTLVVGPAGYGKTTLMAQHFAASRAAGYMTIWLAAERVFDGGDRLAVALLAAFAKACKDQELLQLAMAGPVAATERWATGILFDRLTSADQSVRLYIDDFHLVETEASCILVERLLAWLAPSGRVAVASRRRPQIGLSRLIANGQVRNIDTSQLRFTQAEGAAFLGEGFSSESAASAVRQTEGWPGAMHLVRLSTKMSSGSDWSAPLLPFNNTESPRIAQIHDYLAEQVFIGLDRRNQDFLKAISILDRVEPELARIVSGFDDSANLVVNLAREGCFLFPDGSADGSFHCHQLFRDFLLDRLREDCGMDEAALRRIAAEALYARRRFHEAFNQAILLGDVDFLEELAGRCGGWRLSFVEGIHVWSAVSALPATVVAGHLHLQLSRAYYLLQRGKVREARLCLDQLLDLHSMTDGFADEAELKLFGLVLTIYEDRLIPDDERASLLTTAAGHVDRGDAAVATLIIELLAWERIAAGDFNDAIRLGWDAVRLSEEGDVVLLNAYALMAVALGHFMKANLRAARLHIDRAIDHAARSLGEFGDQHLAARALRAEIAMEQGEFSLAETLIAPVWHELDRLDLWPDLAFSIVRVVSGCAVRSAGLEAALENCEDGRERMHGRGFDRIERQIGLHMVSMALSANRLDRAEALYAEQTGQLRPGFGHDRAATHRMRADHAIVRCRLLMARAASHGENFDLADGLADYPDHDVEHYRPILSLLNAELAFGLGAQDRALDHFGRAVFDCELNQRVLPFLECGGWLDALITCAQSAGSYSGSSAAFIKRVVAIRNPATSDDGGAEIARSVHPPGGLSPREAEVFRFLCAGYTSKEIARRLDLSVNTVMSYRKTMYGKLGVSSRSGLVNLSIQQG
ncbi:MAG: hypothetical protein HC788_03470 [Sphingopyxis sp.]|nr:hypothetical protein [Sphingopyxis sp.]